MPKQMKVFSHVYEPGEILEELSMEAMNKDLTLDEYAQLFIDYGEKIKAERNDETFRIFWDECYNDYGVRDENIMVKISIEHEETDEEYEYRLKCEEDAKILKEKKKQKEIDRAKEILAEHGIEIRPS